MPFPSTITVDPTISFPLGYPNWQPGFQVMQIGTQFYVVLWDTVAVAPQVYVSTDLTGVTWSKAGLPGPAIFLANPSLFASIAVGTIIHFFNVDGFAQIWVVTFDTTTNAWGVPAAGPIALQFPDTWPLSYNPSNNTIIVGTGDGANFRTEYFVWDIGTQTAGAFIPCGIVNPLDPNSYVYIANAFVRGTGRTHMFFVGGPTLGPFPALFSLYQQTLDDGGALGPVTLIDQDVAGAATQDNIYDSFNASSDGTNVVVQWQPQIANGVPDSIKVWKGVSAAIIAFIGQIVSPTNFPIANTVIQCGVKIALLNCDSVTGDITYYLDSGAGFGPAKLIGNLATCTFLCGTGLLSGVAFYMLGSSYFWVVTFTGGGPAGSAMLIGFGGGSGIAGNRSFARYPVMLPDPAINCDTSGRLLASRGDECQAKFPIQLSKGK